MDKKGKHTKESGMIVVETVISFTVFAVMVFSIIYFINMLILHNKVQFAINSAAHELAGYTYLYAAFGGRDAEMAIREDGEDSTQKIDDTSASIHDSYEKGVAAYGSVQNASGKVVELIGSMQDFGGTVSDAGEDGIDLTVLEQQFQKVRSQAADAGDAIIDVRDNVTEAVDQVRDTAAQVKSLVSDKESLISGLAYIGLDAVKYGLKDLLGTGAACLLTKGYLKQGDMDADAFLRAYGVKDGYAGLDFSGSTLFCDEDFRMIDIVVEYDVEVGFMKLLIPNAKMHMVNRVTVPAWLDGDGVKAEPAP